MPASSLLFYIYLLRYWYSYICICSVIYLCLYTIYNYCITRIQYFVLFCRKSCLFFFLLFLWIYFMKVFFNALKLHYLLFWAHQIVKFLLLLHLCFDLCCSVLNFKCNLKFKNFFINVWSAHNFIWKPFVSIQITLQNLITVIIHKFIFTKWRHSKFYHQISLYSWTYKLNLILFVSEKYLETSF